MTSKEYFDQVAPRWEELRSSFYSESLREEALEAAQVEAGRLAADVGAGSGFMTMGLVARGLRVVAVDQSEAMLAELRRRLGDDAPVECRLGRAEALPLDDASVDYAFANMYLHHVEDPPLALREMARILRPGGRLVVTDLDQHDYAWLREEHHDRWMGFRREDVRRWLEEAGLREVRVDCAGESCCAASQEGGETASVGIFIAVALR